MTNQVFQVLHTERRLGRDRGQGEPSERESPPQGVHKRRGQGHRVDIEHQRVPDRGAGDKHRPSQRRV